MLATTSQQPLLVVDRRGDRRASRTALWDVSRLKRVRKCGRYALDPDRGVPVHLAGDVAHFSGLMLCGSVWACPVCSAKIRSGRATEVDVAMRQHLERGGLALFVTLTVRHGVHNRLVDTFGLVADTWRAMGTGRAGKERRDRYGVLGTIRTLEVTHGDHGWHPHLHVLVLVEPGRGRSELVELGDELVEVWCDRIEAAGHPRPARAAQRAEVVEDAAAVAAYVTKVQDDDHGLPLPIAQEMTRSDLKRGRRKGRSPFEILRSFRETGDMADLLRWWEYEEVTRRRHAITWSKGLRALFDLEEVTDEDLAEEEAGGVVVAVVPTSTWQKVVRIRGAGTVLLEAVEAGGIDGLRSALAGLGLPVLLGVPGPILSSVPDPP